MKIVENVIFLLTLQLVLVTCVNVSPKLDFDEQSELIQVRKEVTGKIKGLKVTVDTSELKESKSAGESSTSVESNEKKKTVGVRTDVTFELSSGEDHNDTLSSTNRTKTHDAEDNASIPVVPVFKGKPERGGGGGGSNNRGLIRDSNDLWSVKPLNDPAAAQSPAPERYPPPNRRVDDDYPQYVIWTTERNHHHRRPIEQPPIHFHRDNYDNNNFHRKQSNFIPYQIHHPPPRPLHRPPCNCKEYPGPYIRPFVNSAEQNRNQKVDDKLERPFSRTNE